jgi:DNA-binding MarR family transcriptional regulator
MNTESPATQGLGARLRRLIDLLDADVAAAYAEAGLADYKPRFTPVVRALEALGSATLKDIAAHVGVSHSAVSQTVSEMSKRGFVERRKGADGRERLIVPTRTLNQVLPALKAQWAATARAEAEFNAVLPYSLRQAVDDAFDSLQQERFLDRIRREIIVAANAPSEAP